MKKLFIVFILLFSQVSLQAEDSLDKYIQCRRDTEVRTLLPKFAGKDPCIGSVLIQGISYECGRPADTNRKVREFFIKLTAKAKTRCEEFCKERASGCRATFSAPEKCGFTIPEEGRSVMV
jgi:hypothetical protein